MLAVTLLRASFVSASVSETRFHPARMLQLHAVEMIHTALGMKYVTQQLLPSGAFSSDETKIFC
jgi:hypothetical protein